MEEPKSAFSKTRQTPEQSETKFDTTDGGNTDTTEAAPIELKKRRKYRRVKRKKPEDEFMPTDLKDIPGVRAIAISPVVQNVIGCKVGIDVTAEHPWMYVVKEHVVENLELHEESSEFLPVRNEILEYPGKEILLVYIPSETRDYDEFYICTTAKAEEAASEIISQIQQKREERLNNAQFKAPGQWMSLGSDVEVNDLQERNNRPLLEVELETEYPIMSAPNRFRLRLVEKAHDGYMNLLAPRQTFTNVFKNRIDAAIQVTNPVAETESQTVYTYPKNVFTQYHFEYDPPCPPTQEFKNNLNTFLETRFNTLADALHVNGSLNLYKNDYEDLVNLLQDKIRLQIVKPHASFAEPQICRRKEIAYHTWHRIYTGIFAAAYADVKPSDYQKSVPTYDIVLQAIYDVTPVLLWSFKDTLHPRLLLETPREITALGFCPYDENILVGGCVNGQIVIWDITNKLKGVEEEEVLTPAQKKYKILMNSLMHWMKNTNDPKVVRVTAVSALENSHESAITTILWLQPFQRISRTGKLEQLPEDDDRPGYAFVTASRDGSIMAWSLRSKPVASAGGYRPQRKLRRLKKRPSALNFATSPYRALHRSLIPSFKIIINAPNSTRPLPITEVDFGVPFLTYVEENPNPRRVFDITERLKFKPILERKNVHLKNEFLAGSTEGDFFTATWEGFDFNAGELVNKETAKFENFGKFHDGPVLSISRSPALPNLILTAGGKIFAIWRIDFLGKPLIWRRSKFRYTHGVWNVKRPGLFRLMREDGCYELWHLKNRSDTYIALRPLSNLSLGPTSIHPFLLKQNVIALVDGKGTFRTFLISQEYDQLILDDISATIAMSNREFDRKHKFLKWQEEWTVKNQQFIQEVKDRQALETQVKPEKQETAAAPEEDKEKELEGKGKPEHLEKSHEQRWIENEKIQMKKVILKKKDLDTDVLEKQQIPLLKLEEEIKRRQRKQEQRLSKADKIFKESVAMLFPAAIEKKTQPPPDPYAGGDPKEEKMIYFDKYKEITETCLEFVSERKYEYKFNWTELLERGKERRKMLEGYYNRYSHKQRIIDENKKKESEQTTVQPTSKKPLETKASSESVNSEHTTLDAVEEQ